MYFGGLTSGFNYMGYAGKHTIYSTDSPEQKVAKMARQAVLRGVQNGGGVTEVKLHTDQSGASGVNEYFSALGYTA